MFEQTLKNIDAILHRGAGGTCEPDCTEKSSWLLFLTFKAILGKLNAAVGRALADPQVSKAHLARGFSGTGTTPEAFSRIIARDHQKWAKVLAGVKQ